VASFVFASSCSMYGFADAGPRTEASELNPLTPYAKSKVLAERDLIQLGNENFHVTCLRFSTACGMSPRLRLDLVLNDFVACAYAGETITVLSDGTPWRPLINVADMARAIEWAISRELRSAEDCNLSINVGSAAWNYQVRDLAAAVAERVEGAALSINEDAPHDKRSYRVDFSLYERLAPNHQPIMDLEQSVKQIQHGLQAMGFHDGAFRDSDLMRINHLARLKDQGALDDELRWTGKS